MRASATSRVASSSALPSTQSKSDANKADEASPFALLVNAAQAKPAAQQKDTQDKNAQASNEKQNNAGASQASNASQASSPGTAVQTASQATVKPVKSGKDDDKNDKDKNGDSNSTPADSATAAALQQADAQLQPQQQQSAAQLALMAANAANTAASNDDDAGGDEPAVTAAGAAGVAASGPAKAAQTGQNTQGPSQATAPQAPVPATAQTMPQTVPQTAGQAAGPAASQVGSQAIGQTASQKTAANQTNSGQTPGQTPVQANGAQTQTQDAGANQNAAQSATLPDGTPLPKPWQAKAETGGAKTDPSQASGAKADDVKQVATPVPQTVAANDTPATKPVDLSGNAASIVGGTSPQTQATQGNSAPTITQNVQVSTPTPNMPALAVEIAARSQSGAKQFDIRLDPPELGRVEVRLSIDATGKASAHLSADQPRTLDLLQKDAHILTRALRDAGLDVSQNGLNFSLRQQSGDTGAGAGQNRGGNGRSFTLSATSSMDATSASATYRAPTDGRLDIRV